MSSNYGYDANGWEREPFPARDEHAERRRVVDPKRTAHREAMAAHPGCRECKVGWGTIQPGPPHCRHHNTHCTAAPCW